MNDSTALIHAYLDGELAEDRRRELATWLAGDPGHVDRFIEECCLHSELYDFLGERQVQADALTEAAPPAVGASSGRPAPFVIHTNPAINDPLTTIHSFVGGVLFSYLTAALIVGAGLLVAAAWKLSNEPQIAHQPAPLPSAVGRITGMVDCRWKESAVGSGQSAVGSRQDRAISKSPNLQISKSLVSLGDRFALASGLLEITYDTGAKVILQGPVTYEVESAVGGYLSVGKLTARIGGEGRGTGDGRVASGQWPVASEKSEIGNQKSEISNPQSLIPNPSSLAPPPLVPRPPVLRPNSQRHRDRPRHGVRSGREQGRKDDFACFPRFGTGAGAGHTRN